ncbi:hypothetical protein FA13DRAFT_1742606 [Coprinellus micaceus]|uniref:H-type lectin domain-containing protein n=1 Tax=Coprinellus micaceus TaxID=71717 RepID=A0A4Y7SH31_COPMI|nr:hypothetical protein FA13DRAFT_1742606 [Coprinellus micaceus]
MPGLADIHEKMIDGVADPCDDSVDESVLTAVHTQDGDSVWIPVQGKYLSNIFVKLAKYPGMTLVQIGEPESKDEEPVYVARGFHRGSIVPGYCGFHLQGARIMTRTSMLHVQRYEVLIAKPDQYGWRQIPQSDALIYHDLLGDHSIVLCGGTARTHGSGALVISSPISRWRQVDEWVCGRLLNDEVEGLPRQTPSTVDILVIQSIPIPRAASSFTMSDVLAASAASATLGTYWTDNDWKHALPAGHYSSAVHFSPPLRSIPTIAVGLRRLDLSQASGATIRIRSWPQNVMKDGFICNAQTWSDTILYNTRVDWAAIEEPDWQCGVYKTRDVQKQSWFDHRITFPTQFASPPMVFVCFNGFDMCGNWNLRVYATSVDHAGFNLSILKDDEGDSSTRVEWASITWIAVPGDDALRRRHVWIGQFGTAGMGDIGWDKPCKGHLDFGFQFNRPPKVFMGLNHFRASNGAPLRLDTEASGITESGMDWGVSTWCETIVKGASLKVLAIDSALQ